MNKIYLKELFSFNKQDRRGILLLFGALIILIIANLCLDKFYSPEFEPVDNNEFKRMQSEYYNALNDYNKEQGHKNNFNVSYFEFNPNLVSEEQLHNLGFNNFQIQNLIKYRNKGGTFKSKEDLKKIYGIDTDFYRSLEPYITIKKEYTEVVREKTD